MSFFEARKIAKFFITDFFDKCYAGGLSQTVRFDFRNIISAA